MSQKQILLKLMKVIIVSFDSLFGQEYIAQWICTIDTTDHSQSINLIGMETEFTPSDNEKDIAGMIYEPYEPTKTSCRKSPVH